MKAAILALGVATALRAFAAAPAEGWSPVVDGLRGRLTIEPGPQLAGAELAVVYLELQNVPEPARPRKVYFDPLGSQFRWTLTDETGAQVPAPGADEDILSPLPYWISLPPNSTLRFQISIGGYGIKRDGGIVLGLPGGFWQLPRNGQKRYALSATFAPAAGAGTKAHEPPPPGTGGGGAWQGTLLLPPVLLPQ